MVPIPPDSLGPVNVVPRSPRTGRFVSIQFFLSLDASKSQRNKTVQCILGRLDQVVRLPQ
jgi:hypothetical protein